jgi:protein disulfide-isomerase A1
MPLTRCVTHLPQWFTDSTPTDYNGGRTAADIAKFVKKKTTAAISVLSSVEAADAFKEAGGRLAVVAFLKSEKGKEVTAITEAAEKFDDTFGIVTSAAVASHLGITSKAPAVAMLRTFDEPVVMMEGADITAEKVLEFAEAFSRPLVLPFNDENSKIIFESKFHVLTLLPAEGDHEALLETVRAASQAMRGKKLQFVSVASSEPNNAGVLNFFGATQLTAPKVVGFVMGDATRKFQMVGGDITVDALTTFASQVLDLTAPPLTMSAPPPENNEGPLIEVVGTTVDELVMDPTKDVLLEVYSPQCGHCKALEPVYNKLARRFADVPSVVIAKMDGTANEHSKISVSGFPTLLFFPARENAEPIVFEGDRTLKAFTKFIKEHAVTSYELPKKEKGDAEQGDAASEAAGGEVHDEL